MSRATSHVPEGHRTLAPYLIVRDAAAAIDFYVRALGAKEVSRMPGPDGRVMHAELHIGDSRFMLAEEAKERGALSPTTIGGSPVSLFLYLPDVDARFQQAVSAGATAVSPPADQFWGDRWGMLTDPFGHTWQLATHIEDLTPQEMMERMSKLGANA
jgi:PhnB protein